MKRATRAQFVRWLTDKDADEYVGMSTECHCCPVAQFLLSLDPRSMPYVDSGRWTRWEGSERLRYMPKWASEVVRAADTCGEFRITAGVLRDRLRDRFGWLTQATERTA